MIKVTGLLTFVLALYLPPANAQSQNTPQLPDLRLGDAVVTGFSGTIAPDPRRPRPAGKTAIDLTFIDPDGAAAQIVDISRPGRPWDASLLTNPKKFKVTAGQVGQVFGVAIGEPQRPNVAPDIYLGATSIFGLHIVRRAAAPAPERGLQVTARGANDLVERLKTGAPGAQWANGQFGLGLQGGPGSIYVIDGATGAARVLTNVMLDGVPNPGPGLGNLAYDSARKQLFASDLYTGMIHRIGLDGADLGRFDHGVAARPAAQLPPLTFDPRARLNITNARFSVDNPATWGIAPPARRVWAVTMHQGRLYYSVQDGPQIWSVGFQQDGNFAADARLEVDVPTESDASAATDIAFSTDGAMVVAQRNAFGTGNYNYSAFTRAGEPRVLRFRLKKPGDPASPGLWLPAPEEVSVGFARNMRNANGGVAFGYGYADDYSLNTRACAASLLITGEKLRLDPTMRDSLIPGGQLAVDGLQAGPADAVRDPNSPRPWMSHFVDYDDRFEDAASAGRLGGVRAYTAPCPSAIAGVGAPAFAGGAPIGGVIGGGNPPYVDGPQTGDPGCTGSNCTTNCSGPNCSGCTGSNCNPCQFGTNSDGSCKPPPTDVAYDVGVKKTGFSIANPVNTPATFTLDVTNYGAPINGANVVTVTDVVPAGLTFTSAAGTGWACATLPAPSGSTITCAYTGAGPIATGATFPPITVQATGTGDGPFENCATTGLSAASGGVDTNATNDKSCVTVHPFDKQVDLAVVKTGGTSPAPQVNGYAFHLAVTSVAGVYTGANAITVTDTVPAGMTFNSATGTNWTCASLPASAGATITCTYTGAGPSAPNQSLGVINIVATASGSAPFPPFTNCARVGVDHASGAQDTNPANDQSCVTVTKPPLAAHDVAIKKTGGGMGGTNGPNYAFNLAVTNVGVAFNGAGALIVTDVVPAGMTFLSAAGTNWTCNTPVSAGGTLTCAYTGSGSIASGAVLSSIAITAVGPANTPFENCASVTFSQPSTLTDTNLANNKSCITVNGNALGSLVVKKEVVNHTPGTIPPMTFPIAVNCGGVITNMSLADGASQTINNIPLNTSCSAVEAAPAAPNTCAVILANWTTAYVPAGPVAVTGAGATITVRNTLDCVTHPPGTGRFLVRKEIFNGPASNQTFQVSVTCDGVVYNIGVTTALPAEITPLPLTATCAVAEAPSTPPAGACATGMQASWVATYLPANTATVASNTGVTVRNALKCDPIVRPVSSPPVLPVVTTRPEACPQGTVRRSGRCVEPPKTASCRAPMVANADGSCACPSGTIRQGRQCVEPRRAPTCRAPMVENADGSCACPSGTTRRGARCIAPPRPAVCNAPARPNARGVCVCPPNMVARGRSCAPREQPGRGPTAGDVIRVLPALIGIIPFGRGGGGPIPRGVPGVR